jgi:hypothetical protein
MAITSGNTTANNVLKLSSLPHYDYNGYATTISVMFELILDTKLELNV